MKKVILAVLFSVGLLHAQPTYEVFELPKGKLEEWTRDKTTNPNATDKLPIYYVTGEYLLRIEPTNNYYTQLFDKQYRMVWETNSTQMKGSFGTDFINHAKTLFNSGKYIYQVDYGLNYGGGVLKVFNITTGENQGTQFKIGTGDADMPVMFTDNSHPFFEDEMMYVVASKGKKTYLTSTNSSGVLVNKEISGLEGSSYYSDLTYRSNVGLWVYGGMELKKKHLLNKIYIDDKANQITLETAWLSSSGTATADEKYEIDITNGAIVEAEAISWEQNGEANTLLIAFGAKSKEEEYTKVIYLYHLADGKVVDSEEYLFGNAINPYDKVVWGGVMWNMSAPIFDGEKFKFKLRLYKYGGANTYKIYYQLNFSAGKDLKLSFENDAKNDPYESTIKGLAEYNNEVIEAGATESFYKPEAFDNHRLLHQYIIEKTPITDKNCRYVGFYFNNKYILIRDDYYTLNPTVFQFNF